MCNNLVSVRMSAFVTSIGTSAFWGCSSLEGIIIPASVTKIGSSAFWGCGSLTSIVVKATTPPTGDSYMFNGTENSQIYVPSGSVEAYKSAQYWSDYAERIQAIEE